MRYRKVIDLICKNQTEEQNRPETEPSYEADPSRLFRLPINISFNIPIQHEWNIEHEQENILIH